MSLSGFLSKHGKSRTAIALAGSLGLLAIAAFALTVLATPGMAPASSADRPDYGLSFDLVDHAGRPISQAAFVGQPSAVFFGFTHCPEICPTTLYEMSAWFQQLGEDGKAIKGYFVTIDPERDRPEIIASYVDSFADRITGITGDAAEIKRVADAWGVFRRKVPLEGGGYTMDHTASVFLLDEQGRFQGRIGYGEDMDSAVAKLQALITTR